MKRRTPSEVVDDYLVLECQAGNPEAFERLVGRFHSRFLRHAFRYTKNRDVARDIAQESWMAVIQNLFRLSDPSRFRPWAYRIVANKARDWVRREQRRRRATGHATASDTVPIVGETHGLIERIRRYMEDLEPDQRLILTWFYVEDLSLADIAEALSIPVGTVKSRLFNARATLRARLTDNP